MRNNQLSSWWLPRLFGRGGPDLRIVANGLTWVNNDDTRLSNSQPESLKSASISKGLFWSSVVIEQDPVCVVDTQPRTARRKNEFKGYRTSEAEVFVARLRRYLAGQLLDQSKDMIRKALDEWNHPAGKDQYMTLPFYKEWRKRYSELQSDLQNVIELKVKEHPRFEVAVKFRDLLALGESARHVRNEAWVLRQREVHEELFSRGFGYPLSDEQIQAILRDEHRSLVVAGAGTGKTSTVVAKARWIQAQGLSDQNRVKILAFNKKAAEEINERLGTTTSDNSLASTFHSLGLSLAAQARGSKPRLTKLDEDERLLQSFICSCINDGLKDPSKSASVIEFLTYFRYPEPDIVPLEKSHEANRWADGHDIRSITGVKLRSNFEVTIANWLTLHGIKWEYEPRYVLNTATVLHSQYQPDFYLPEHNVYIEHWACDESGRLPKHWSRPEQENYKEGMQWKRNLHAESGTTLLETFSSIEGGHAVISRLIEQLNLRKIYPKPISDEERNKIVSVDDVIFPVVTLVSRFLALFRESGSDVKAIQAELLAVENSRGLSFIKMFDWIHDQYIAHLHAEEVIDFSDMIREAASALRSGAADLALEYLLVDEFQDISRGRANLISAVLEKNPDCRLIAVGDDWQSIYRFAGSDIGVMVEFGETFGDTCRTDLRKTHRFGSLLLQATSAFIQANPQQLKKNLIAARPDEAPAIEIISSASTSKLVREREAMTYRSSREADAGDDELETDTGRYSSCKALSEEEAGVWALGEALRQIADESESASVLVLGRYNFLRKRLTDQNKRFPELSVSFSTVHRAKGLEADYVVILDVVTGKYGFPSEIEDDPIMNLVLSVEAGIPNAEERRLFYVAMTRARRRTYILTDDHKRSQFIDELEGEVFSELVVPSGAAQRVAACPICGGSTLKIRVSQYGQFYGCSSVRCPGKALRCPYCKGGGLVRRENQFTCLFCNKHARPCPNCSRGYVRHIPAGVAAATGRPYAAFDACSTNQKEPRYTCWTGRLQ